MHYQNSTGVVGVLLVKCDTEEQLQDLVSNIYDYVKVIVD